MKIHEDVLKMVSPEGFDEVFYKTVNEMDLTYVDAFHLLNMYYKTFFGEKRYSSYDSYRISRRKRLENRNNVTE